MEVTGDPLTHQALLVELPIFIATAAEPIATVVMPVVSHTAGRSAHLSYAFTECCL
jgi:hypothetical protein